MDAHSRFGIPYNVRNLSPTMTVQKYERFSYQTGLTKSKNNNNIEDITNSAVDSKLKLVRPKWDKKPILVWYLQMAFIIDSKNHTNLE